MGIDLLGFNVFINPKGKEQIVLKLFKLCLCLELCEFASTLGVRTFRFVLLYSHSRKSRIRRRWRVEAHRVQLFLTFTCQKNESTTCQGRSKTGICEILKSWLKMNVGHLCQYILSVWHTPFKTLPLGTGRSS